ncbi:hypothetical protein LTR85_005193 [Meristemomyces frigidus]|nr:hypothetical protein LTR85_005193 [Meristemomyces frigidus]
MAFEPKSIWADIKDSTEVVRQFGPKNRTLDCKPRKSRELPGCWTRGTLRILPSRPRTSDRGPYYYALVPCVAVGESHRVDLKKHYANADTMLLQRCLVPQYATGATITAEQLSDHLAVTTLTVTGGRWRK